MKMVILLLVLEEQLSLRERTLSTGKLPLGGLPRNRVVRIMNLSFVTTAPYISSRVWDSRLQNQILIPDSSF